ncbi:MAG: hypothetical protein L0I76_29935 [Pseudonocardia sp.]|nr:hypothetical protein [Pseudonocardia sp.]
MAAKRLIVSPAQVAAAKLKLKRATAAGRQVDHAVRAIAAAQKPSPQPQPGTASAH